jgi:hypothetical protein
LEDDELKKENMKLKDDLHLARLKILDLQFRLMKYEGGNANDNKPTSNGIGTDVFPSDKPQTNQGYNGNVDKPSKITY